MNSIREDLEAAFKNTEGKEEEIIDKVEEEEESGETAEPAAKAEKPEPEPAEKDEPAAKVEAEAPGTWDHNKAPTSWSPKVRELWAQLPEEARREIVRREEASVNGVRKLQEEFAPIRQQFEPIAREAQQLGVDPGQYLNNVVAAERALRSNDINQRFATILNLADQYGVPIRQYLNGGQQPQQYQQSPEVMRELEAMRTYREQAERSTLESQVNAFKADKEFFEDVRETMADLIDSGAAKDLDSAYQAAIWTNPEVRAVLLEREKAGATKTQQDQRRKAAAGASVKGTADIDVDTDDDDSIEGLIRKSMKSAAGRL